MLVKVAWDKWGLKWQRSPVINQFNQSVDVLKKVRRCCNEQSDMCIIIDLMCLRGTVAWVTWITRTQISISGMLGAAFFW